jgi:hypothetical protein
MTDFMAHDDEDRWGADRGGSIAETERRAAVDAWCVAPHPARAAACPQWTAATERWSRSVLILAAVAVLSWAVVIGIVIAALATL